MSHGGARPNSGPKKGVPSKPRQTLLRLLQEKFPGYHPVVNIAKTANDPEATRAERFAADKEVAKYVTPALKAIDHSFADQGSIDVTVRLVPHDED